MTGLQWYRTSIGEHCQACLVYLHCAGPPDNTADLIIIELPLVLRDKALCVVNSTRYLHGHRWRIFMLKEYFFIKLGVFSQHYVKSKAKPCRRACILLPSLSLSLSP